MATTPGFLTDWPWRPLGTFKYVLLAPWVAHSVYSFVTSKEESERDYTNLLVFPFLLSRILHNQLWISYSRHRTGTGKNRILDKPIEFDQVDRESNWDDNIMLSGLLIYVFNVLTSKASQLPAWRLDGLLITVLLHAGPVEFLYYWLHRALHHHYLYSRYHSHHHSSIVTEPITSVIHPFGEHLAYFLLFAIPMLTTVFSGTASNVVLFGYITYIDLMNNLGHCNFEFIPTWLFSICPPLKYLMYTPSYHSLHHTQFRTNYSLFMPFYDYMYGTMDKSTHTLYETSLKKEEDSPDLVHLTHLTNLESIFFQRIGFSSWASFPQRQKWYFWLMSPITYFTMIMNCIYGQTFIAERNVLDKIKLQSWVIPKYKVEYLVKWQSQMIINNLIEKAILDAEAKGVKVLSLGLLNQSEELNNNGEIYIQKHKDLKIKIVDGSSLANAIVVNTIPKETTEVLLIGKLTKACLSLASTLSQSGIKVVTSCKDNYKKLKLSSNCQSNFALSESFTQKIWLVGEGLTEEEQNKAMKGTLFIPISQLPPKKFRHDCFYHYTPAMLAPPSLQNMHTCEDWLPRRVMSAARVSGIVHVLEGWNVHEFSGETMLDINKIWLSTLSHGFQPLPLHGH
ncbi:unnamed protein product [Cuscuta epithymum]|uniref:Protein ECERIFERUM 1-like n=1 Tax=Cuscuta epithymum TaxID=186058 RepID=A0AAV0F8B3_9ASTE|nr:unnamed protein product [Cuscuta epithymum]